MGPRMYDLSVSLGVRPARMQAHRIIGSVIVFDVLYFKTPTVTKQLISVALRERKKLLYTAFGTEIGAIHIADFIKGTSVEDISERLKIVLEERYVFFVSSVIAPF